MLFGLHKISLAVLAWGATQVACQQDVASAGQQQQYEYVVVGSGPGGGPLAADLARAGHSVLLLEAGSDLTDDPNYKELQRATFADNDIRSRWDFFVKHSDDPARELKYEHMVWRLTNGTLYVGLNPPAGAKQLGVWYPRAAVLGGCAMHNAAFMEMPTDDYWNDLAAITGDQSWKASSLRSVFQDIENCHYEPKGTPGHGFSGWLDDIQESDGSWLDNNTDGTALLQAIAELTGAGKNLPESKLKALLSRDINGLDVNQHPLGVFGLVVHADTNASRVSPANYIRKTIADSAHYPLKLQLNAFVTSILWEPQTSSAKQPVAKGVEYTVGQSVYQADPRYTKPANQTKLRAIATKEVIIAGGAFNSPQILKVSGVGPADELKKFKIPVVADLPGVGNNLGDNYEGVVVSLAADAPGNLGGTYAVYLNTSQSEGPRDIFMWAFNGAFEGFWPGFPDNLGPNATTFAFVHMGSRNAAGTVKLRSADPTEPPEINLRYFQDGGDQDLQAMLEAVNFVEKVKDKIPASTGMKPFTEVHPCPGSPQKCTDAVKKENLKLQAYSHHATGTCAMGKASDPNAVVDSNFKVKGVKNLRVVDASIFPKPPGAFPVLPTFLISRKAVKAILSGV